MSPDSRHILVDLGAQTLTLFDGETIVDCWPISSALNGPGEREGSGCTPRGKQRVRLKIGDGCAPDTVFVARRPTGERYTPALAVAEPSRDWILTRILWLTGCEPGYNRGGACDTLRRYIYIHGCPDTEPMGVPRSHGCIRMRNDDIIELFDRIDNGCPVHIVDGGDA
jgi:hypothetical protein